MERPSLVRQNANLPPNVSKENAFYYQTNSRPYNFNMPMGHQHMHRRRETQRPSLSCDYDDDDDGAAFDVTDSEADEEDGQEEEDEYETNIHLALDNDSPHSRGSDCNSSRVDTTRINDDGDDDDDDDDGGLDDHDKDYDNNDHPSNTNAEITMTAFEKTERAQVMSRSDNSQIDCTPPNFCEPSATSTPSNGRKGLTANPVIHNQNSCPHVSNEEQDNFNNPPDSGNEMDERRRMPSLSYMLPSDDIIISDENEGDNENENGNENASENNGSETEDNNTFICQENDM